MKKKLLFVIESFAIGGAEKSLVNLLNTLDFSGHEVTVVAFAKGGALEAQLPDFINPIHLQHRFSRLMRIKFFLARKVLRPQQTENLFWKIFSTEVPQFAGSWDVAVAYGQGFPTYFVASKVRAKKKLAWVNTDYIKAGYSAKFDAHFYRQMHGIVNVSDAGKESFDKAFLYKNLNTEVYVIEDLINHGYITGQAAEIAHFANQAALKLVTVGRLHPAKGYSMALEAANILKDHINFEWKIVGEGPERQRLENLIEKYSLQNKVYLVGADSNPYKYMAAADIYIQTSLYEGFSITVREAKVLGKLIVSTNFPSIHSAITDGENGILADMTPDSIAEKIIAIASDSKLQQKILSNLQLENQTGEQNKINALTKLLLK